MPQATRGETSAARWADGYMPPSAMPIGLNLPATAANDAATRAILTRRILSTLLTSFPRT